MREETALRFIDAVDRLEKMFYKKPAKKLTKRQQIMLETEQKFLRTQIKNSL
jgi:hypothetical protein